MAVLRTVDHGILLRARCIITAADTLEKVNRLYDDIDNLFREGGTCEAAVRQRWTYLLQNHCVPGSALHVHLQTEREERRENAGNTLTGPLKSATNVAKAQNTDELAQIITNYGPGGPKVSKSFYVPAKTRTAGEPSVPVGGFPPLPDAEPRGEAPDVYHRLTFDGIRKRTKNRSRQDNDHRNKVPRYPHLSIQKKGSPIFCQNGDEYFRAVLMYKRGSRTQLTQLAK